MAGIYDFSAKALAGAEISLKQFEGQVLLIVNTASACGFTPQYKGLETLHQELAPRGLAVLGFPCNQFGGQEPGDAAQIAEFCSLTYDVDFPMMKKIDVNGPTTPPLYAYLKKQQKGVLGTEGVKWNFTKFLVDRKGEVVERFAPTVKPEALE